MIGQSPAMQRIFRLIGKIAPTESPLPSRGRAARGTEMIRLIHLQAGAPQALRPVNSWRFPSRSSRASSSATVRGGSGPTSDRVGLMEHADRARFLDEVGRCRFGQVKALRALQTERSPWRQEIDARGVA